MNQTTQSYLPFYTLQSFKFRWQQQNNWKKKQANNGIKLEIKSADMTFKEIFKKATRLLQKVDRDVMNWDFMPIIGVLHVFRVVLICLNYRACSNRMNVWIPVTFTAEMFRARLAMVRPLEVGSIPTRRHVKVKITPIRDLCFFYLFLLQSSQVHPSLV